MTQDAQELIRTSSVLKSSTKENLLANWTNLTNDQQNQVLTLVGTAEDKLKLAQEDLKNKRVAIQSKYVKNVELFVRKDIPHAMQELEKRDKARENPENILLNL